MGDDSKQDLYSHLREHGLSPSPPPPSSAADASDEADDDGSSAFLRFHDEDVGEKLRQASDDERNAADFGIIRVDDRGRVQFYNRYESGLSGVAPEEALGQDFFTQLAPCSNNRLFSGRFERGIRSGHLDERCTYTFTYKVRPTLVDVRLYRDEAGNNWILVRKR